MFKKLYAGALALAGFTSATDALTDDQKAVACVEYPSEWNKFDLRPLTSSDSYNSEGLEFNFCEYLSQTSYFASMLVRTSSGALHTEVLTSSDPLPASTEEIETDGSVNGIKVTWGSEEPCATGGT